MVGLIKIKSKYNPLNFNCNFSNQLILNHAQQNTFLEIIKFYIRLPTHKSDPLAAFSFDLLSFKKHLRQIT
jgi:hypothetical protein